MDDTVIATLVYVISSVTECKGRGWLDLRPLPTSTTWCCLRATLSSSAKRHETTEGWYGQMPPFCEEVMTVVRCTEKSESCPRAKCCLINTLTRSNRYWRHSFHRVGPVGTSMCLYLRYFLYCLPYCQECFELGGHLKVLLVNVGYRTIREQQANVTGYFQACNFLGYPYSCKANNRFLFDNFSCSG